jgi:hypothetical protein
MQIGQMLQWQAGDGSRYTTLLGDIAPAEVCAPTTASHTFRRLNWFGSLVKHRPGERHA